MVLLLLLLLVLQLLLPLHQPHHHHLSLLLPLLHFNLHLLLLLLLIHPPLLSSPHLPSPSLLSPLLLSLTSPSLLFMMSFGSMENSFTTHSKLIKKLFHSFEVSETNETLKKLRNHSKLRHLLHSQSLVQFLLLPLHHHHHHLLLLLLLFHIHLLLLVHSLLQFDLVFLFPLHILLVLHLLLLLSPLSLSPLLLSLKPSLNFFAFMHLVIALLSSFCVILIAICIQTLHNIFSTVFSTSLKLSLRALFSLEQCARFGVTPSLFNHIVLL